MSKIHIFIDVEEAVSLLKVYKKDIIKKEISKEQIVRESISSNIFRAFHKLNRNPSLIYREWASKNIDEIIQKLNSIATKEEYDKQLFKWVYSFINYWNFQVINPDDRIIFGPASKMINLLIKMLNESTYLNNEKIITFFNVPFDKFSLEPLINIINQLSDVNYKVDIPKNPTMKYISTPELYWIVQNAVFKLCEKAGINPILYDYWCWNEKH
ncbi:MAG: hypothetical protein AABW67_01065 [Nanoarchaeota archaeon]